MQVSQKPVPMSSGSRRPGQGQGHTSLAHHRLCAAQSPSAGLVCDHNEHHCQRALRGLRCSILAAQMEMEAQRGPGSDIA